jgi:hypothetical protein
MALADPKPSLVGYVTSWAWDFVLPAGNEPHTVAGYRVEYSEPSQKALDAVDPKMKAYIAESKVVSVEGEL